MELAVLTFGFIRAAHQQNQGDCCSTRNARREPTAWAEMPPKRQFHRDQSVQNGRNPELHRHGKVIGRAGFSGGAPLPNECVNAQ